MPSPHPASRRDLVRIAIVAMRERGPRARFPGRCETPARARSPARPATDTGNVRDLTGLPWCSIDNDDSLDLDQLTACEPLAGGAVKLCGRHRRRRRAREEGLADRRARRGQHDLGLHLGASLPDAARAAVDRPHVAQPGPGPPGHGHRDGRRAPTRRSRSSTRLSGARAQQGQARLRRGLGVDRRQARRCPTPRGGARHGRAAAHAGRGSRSGCARAATRRARSSSRPSSRARCSRATGGRHPPAGAEPRAPADRGADDRHQRLHGALPRSEAAQRRCAAWCARPSAGSASSRSPRATARRCRDCPTPQALEAFLARRRQRGPAALSRPVARRSSS